MKESFWNPRTRSATERFFVVDTRTAEVTCHALTTEAYTDGQLRAIISETGFTDIRAYPSLIGAAVDDESQSANFAVVASKGSSVA